MLVAAISDTHMPRGARRLPEACIERLTESDLILHAGDISSVAVLDELRALGPTVHAVHGNADEAALRALLPEELVVEAGDARIGLVHVPGPAAGRAERLLARFPACGAVVYGHTHVPVVERYGETLLMNPGSPTERRRSPIHSMLMLEIEAGEIRAQLVRLS